MACQGQTLQLTTNINKLQLQKFYTIGSRGLLEWSQMLKVVHTLFQTLGQADNAVKVASKHVIGVEKKFYNIGSMQQKSKSKKDGNLKAKAKEKKHALDTRQLKCYKPSISQPILDQKTFLDI